MAKKMPRKWSKKASKKRWGQSGPPKPKMAPTPSKTSQPPKMGTKGGQIASECVWVKSVEKASTRAKCGPIPPKG